MNYAYVSIMSFRYYNPNQVGGMMVYGGSRKQRGGMMVYEGSRRQRGGMLVYEGSRRQRGGNLITDGLKRVFLPIGKELAKRGLKMGKDLAKRGVKVGVGTLRDRLQGGSTVSMKEALKKRSIAAADKAIVDYLGTADQPDIPFLSQDGLGLRRRGTKRKASTKRAKSINKGRKKKQQQRDIFS